MREGLAAGDLIVVAGLLKIRDGVPVQVPVAGRRAAGIGGAGRGRQQARDRLDGAVR